MCCSTGGHACRNKWATPRKRAPIAAHAMGDATHLSALTSACTLTKQCLAEREPHPAIYAALETLTQCIQTGGEVLAAYALFEYTLLTDCGYGLDLTTCAATGQP